MQIKNEQYNWVIEFLREAGEIALQYQDKVTESLKANKSIVTEADIKISNLFSEYMVKNTDENHCLIDEEKCATVEEFKKKNSNKEYIWILDPIDGTKPYYHGLSTWGIMVSLFKNGEPIMSACYAPAMRDLIFANNVDRMYVKNPFTKDEEVKEMQATSRDLDNQSIVIAPEWLSIYNPVKVRKDVFYGMDLFSTAIHTICFFSGKIHGTVFARIASLWDMSSAIAFSNFLGMKLVDIRTGQEIKTLDLNIVENNWILKHIYLLTKPEHFSEIVKMIEYKE